MIKFKSLFEEQWATGKTNGIAYAMGGGIANESFGKPNVLYTTMGGASPGGRSYLFTAADLELSVAITTNCEGDGEQAYQLALSLIRKFAGLD